MSTEVRQTPPELGELLAAGHGTATVAGLRGVGISQREIRQLVARGVLARVGRGAFVDAALLEKASRDESHRLRAVALARTWPPGVAVSHSSAALLHGLPLLMAPGRVRGSRCGPATTRSASGYVLHGGMPQAGAAGGWREVRGVPVVGVAHAVLGVAQLHGVDAGVVALDAALHARMLEQPAVEAVLDLMPHHPVHRRGRTVVMLSDARSESPGESRTRLLLQRLGYEVESQVVVMGRWDEFVGRADLALRGERVVVEFDGRAKYVNHGQSAAGDRARDQAMQDAGYEVVRVVWQDLATPDVVRQRIEHALRRVRARGRVA